jgi:alpha-glucosidase (family GH31 glycosyl hydrolase)
MNPLQFETTASPFSISIKRNKEVMATIKHDTSPAIVITSNETSITALFPSFSLNLIQIGENWKLTTSPEEANAEILIDVPGYWYGHGELIHQNWPLNKIMLQSAPLITFDNGPTGLSGVMSPAWFSSNGTLLIADSPIELGINQPPKDYPKFKWTFVTEGRGAFSDRPFLDDDHLGDGLFSFRGKGLDLSLSFTNNAVEAFHDLVKKFGHPSNLPPESLFEKPTWTTWARYKTAINQDVVLEYAADIIRHNYPFNILEIDDRWQVYYGDLSFDPNLFPNPKEMVDKLHSQGFKVTLWVIPFLDPRSFAFSEGESKGYLVCNPNGVPYLVDWWQGKGGLLDVSNPAALDWFFDRLTKLQNSTGVDGYKFDAGEACFLPSDAVTFGMISSNDYTHIYVDAIAKRFQFTEVRSGWNNQKAGIFFRQWDKTTSWGLDNGLHSVLTGILALGLAGYPFVLADMVGGNEYDEKASPEMMIRWTQLNALLPSLQFSLAPWDYGKECEEICRRYAAMHVEFSPKIIDIAKSSLITGIPIIRPIFWHSPHDEKALLCDDEFLLGNEILVAPVVTPNTLERDIYLPIGNWQDYWTHHIFAGPINLENYPAPLQVLPIFIRIE